MTLLLPILLFLIAAGYAAVGLGGGSAYLAVLSFWSHDPHVIRPLAWGLNIVAAGMGFINYYRAGHFSWSFSTPLVIGGIAGGAVGARLPISMESFNWLLAVTLFLIALRMFLGKKPATATVAGRRAIWPISVAMGFLVGVISGLVGIGGGIILGPIILALRWTDVKTSAAMTSLYVALSSAGALGGHIQGGGAIDLYRLLGYGAICLVGAYIGSRFGARKASPRTLELIFGSLVLIASIRLAWINL
jgi:uncharacterized membrane protein YfcA